jgi:hypothetical protein
MAPHATDDTVLGGHPRGDDRAAARLRVALDTDSAADPSSASSSQTIGARATASRISRV